MEISHVDLVSFVDDASHPISSIGRDFIGQVQEETKKNICITVSAIERNVPTSVKGRNALLGVMILGAA